MLPRRNRAEYLIVDDNISHLFDSLLPMLMVQVELGQRQLVQRPLRDVLLQQHHEARPDALEDLHHLLAWSLVVHCFFTHFLVFLPVQVVF